MLITDAQIAFLRANSSSSFYSSLLGQFERKGSLSEKQIACIQKAIDKAAAPRPAALETHGLNGKQIEIKSWLARTLAKELGIECFFRNLEVVACEAETAKAFRCKVRFVSTIANACHCCGKELDTEVSRLCGIGPVCAGKLGLPRPTVATAHETLRAIEAIAAKIGTVGPVWIAKSQIVQREASQAPVSPAQPTTQEQVQEALDRTFKEELEAV